MPAKTVFYSSVGPELARYDVDVADAALQRRGAVTLPANVQYAWPHPSKRYLYVVSSNGGPGLAGDTHLASALRIDPASGALAPHGEPRTLPSRPIHASVDGAGEFLLTAYNAPSNVTVHRLNRDGTIGDQVSQPGKPDAGIYAHQVRTTPGNQTAILVTRGNNAAPGKPEDPGALKLYALQGRRADEPRFGRARQRARLRTAPSRFPSERAVGLCLDRAAEQALCLHARRRRRARTRAAVRQGHLGRSRQRQAGAGGRPHPRASRRPLRLCHQPQPGRGRCRRQEGVQRRREQRRRVRDRCAQRRARR